jgi:hypothetical protein
MRKTVDVYLVGSEAKRLRLKEALPSLIPQFRTRLVNNAAQIPELDRLLVFISWDHNDLSGMLAKKLHPPVLEYLKARGNVMIVALRNEANPLPDGMSVQAKLDGFPFTTLTWSRRTANQFDYTDKTTIQAGMRIQMFLLKDLMKGAPSTPSKTTAPRKREPSQEPPPHRVKTQESSDEELPAPLPQTQPPEVHGDPERDLIRELAAVEEERNNLVDRLVKLGQRSKELKKKLQLYQ